MEEIVVDQEDVVVKIVAEEVQKEEVVDIEVDYSNISDDDITTIDESEIDWSIL